jgi:hypothetical protein
MKTHYPPEWRTQKKWKRRFYAKYMKWLEVLGYVTVTCVIGAFILAFNVRVDDVISADKVPLRAQAEVIKATAPTHVVRAIVEDFTDVPAGAPVLEIVIGESEIRRFQIWQSAQELKVPSPVPRPPTTLVAAPVAGTFVRADESGSETVEADAPLGEIRNYARLVASASLTGQGVAKAQPGGQATLKGLTVEPHHGILVRGETDTGSLVSSQLGGETLRTQVAQRLEGKSFFVRDDLPLRFSGLNDVQIDAQLATQAANGGSLWAEPSATVVLSAAVISGQHGATLQFAQLPPDVRDALNQDIRAALRQNIRTLNGEALTITDVSRINTVIRAKAVPAEPGASASDRIPATAVSRSFDAELSIENPPAYLVEAVKSADRAGKLVTAKVELKTGDRPIATLLLRRS